MLWSMLQRIVHDGQGQRDTHLPVKNGVQVALLYGGLHRLSSLCRCGISWILHRESKRTRFGVGTFARSCYFSTFPWVVARS